MIRTTSEQRPIAPNIGAAMPAATPPSVVAQVIAMWQAGEQPKRIKELTGIGRTTIYDIVARAELQSDGIDQPVRRVYRPAQQATPPPEALAESLAAASTAASSAARATLGRLENLAVEKLREWLETESWPAAQRVRIALWVLERTIPSADAREHSRASKANAEAYVEVIARITAPDEEIERRMAAIEEAQDAVVAARRPHVVTDGDVAA